MPELDCIQFCMPAGVGGKGRKTPSDLQLDLFGCVAIGFLFSGLLCVEFKKSNPSIATQGEADCYRSFADQAGPSK
jgi:hypothetical protein